MTTYKLLDSLINPPSAPLVEAEAAPAANPPLESLEIGEVELKGGYHRGGFRHELYVTYTHANLPSELYITVIATLNTELTSEDNSFDYSYGSENGTHTDLSEYFEDLSWKDVAIPHVADNMDLFKLEGGKVQHITQFITGYLANMDASEIAPHLDVEKLIRMVKADEQNSLS
jgi:hypothetical protein